MKSKTYHVGLLAKCNMAVFQFRQSKDDLNCEILEYMGMRRTTKQDARIRLQGAGVKAKVLEDLNTRYPNKRFMDVVID